MEKPALKLPPDQFGAIFRIHADAVRRSAELSRVGATVVVQDGAEADELVPAKLPWCRLTAVPGDSAWFAGDGTPGGRILACPWRINVECKVDGSRLEDSSRFGMAILDALFPSDPAALAAMEAKLDAAGLHERTPARLWWGVGLSGPSGEKLPTPPAATYALGWLDLVVHLEF